MGYQANSIYMYITQRFKEISLIPSVSLPRNAFSTQHYTANHTSSGDFPGSSPFNIGGQGPVKPCQMRPSSLFYLG